MDSFHLKCMCASLQIQFSRQIKLNLQEKHIMQYITHFHRKDLMLGGQQ